MNTATTKQINFIKKLQNERIVDCDLYRIATDTWRGGGFTKEYASSYIDELLDSPYVHTMSNEAPEGMHYMNGSVYKVQRAVHGSGNVYAKKLHLEFEEKLDEIVSTKATFVYAPGAVRYLNEHTLMSLQKAKEFGALYGTCCVCGKTLTNEVSIKEGIGPVCEKNF